MTLNVSRPGAQRFCRVLTAGLVSLATGVQQVQAQRPERQQEGRVPAIGIELKAGWQLLSYDGCRFAVPPSWRPNPDNSQVFAPDGSNLSMRRLHFTSWSMHKSQIRAAFGQVRNVHEDSDRRLWLEIGNDQRVQHYIAVANGSGACAGLLEIRVSTPDPEQTTNIIADSIGTATAEWPPAFK
jgi:hypothetical protein